MLCAVVKNQNLAAFRGKFYHGIPISTDHPTYSSTHLLTYSTQVQPSDAPVKIGFGHRL